MLLAGGAWWLYGQDAKNPVFRTKVDLVVLSFTVTDSKGRYINGLKPNDVRITEDGILQRISTFAEGASVPSSPERSDLRERGAAGRGFELSGFVLTRRCRPLGGAVVDLWHADDKGEYDNTGFRYRGHVITGPDGAFSFRTIVPAVYTGRTRHYHVKVQAPGSRLLTTQLYFPNEPANLRDGLFQRQLLMRVAAPPIEAV